MQQVEDSATAAAAAGGSDDLYDSHKPVTGLAILTQGTKEARSNVKLTSFQRKVFVVSHRSPVWRRHCLRAELFGAKLIKHPVVLSS